MAFRNPLFPTQVDRNDLVEIIKNGRSVTLRGSEFSGLSVGTTSSFFYDPPTQGLKSTQQLNVDWSKFENHTFFNSAEVNTNVAFDKLINFFPFDGTKKELEAFFEKLTGFEKYVYDRFPKNCGYLYFNDSYISVKDYAGSLFPEISKNKTGKAVLTPEDSFTIEYHLYIPDTTNGLEVVCQKISGTDGITSFVSSSSSTTSAVVGLTVSSGSAAAIASASIEKGRFHHIAFVYDKDVGDNLLTMYKNGNVVARSNASDINRIAIESSNFTIGSGTLFKIGTSTQLPTQILSGALDEFRFFHSARSIEEIQEFAYKNVFASEDLKLYYKFNEPTGSFGSSDDDTINSIVLDSSGQSLHGYITNFSHDLRSTGSLSIPLLYEKLNLNPVLFPGHADIVDLNSVLLTSATLYDSVNPNIITKLLPPHYIVEGREASGLASDMGSISNTYGGNSVPGNGKLGQTQLLLSMLYVWAKFFDEVKLYVDSFARSEDVDYDSTKSAADHFLPLLFKKWGVKVPAFFVDSTIEQFIDAENLQPVISTDENSLQYIQNQILRRVLTNLNEIVKSKGTQHSVRAFLRSMGFDPDNSFRIKEYGGPTRRNLSFSRESKSEIGKMLDFVSGGHVQSGFLSSSRIEVGFPEKRSSSVSFVQKNQFPPHGVSNSIHDGLWTSGSWTYEGLYRFPQGRYTPVTQSLARMQVTGTNAGAQPGLLFNLLAISGSEPRIVLYGRTSLTNSASSANVLTLELTGTNIFNGDPWNISFGMLRDDESLTLSSSYYLRAGTQNAGQVQLFTTQSYYKEIIGGFNISNNALATVTGTMNASGSFITIGSASIPAGSNSAYAYLNLSTVANNEMRSTLFAGQVAQVRFWSKSTTEDEWREHVRNPKSLGVEDPAVNFNFNTALTGAFNRLRMDVSMDQQERITNSSGYLVLRDFSQNNVSMVATSFPTSKQIFSPVIWNYDYISPNFDDGITNEKVRVRSYQSYEKVAATPWAQVGPVYQVNPSEQPMDDPRFSIEFSLVDALNKDIVNIFSTLDALDNAIGDPNLAFSADYPNLETIKSVYFNRLTDKINLNRFFDMYRWFDASISSFIENIVPRKTKYLGSNFVVESHMLERHKKEYFHSDIYVATNDRHNIQNVLLLQQVAGTIKKH